MFGGYPADLHIWNLDLLVLATIRNMNISFPKTRFSEDLYNNILCIHFSIAMFLRIFKSVESHGFHCDMEITDAVFVRE